MRGTGVKRNILGRCSKFLAVNRKPGWDDMGGTHLRLEEEERMAALKAGGLEFAGDRAGRRPGGLDDQP